MSKEERRVIRVFRDRTKRILGEGTATVVYLNEDADQTRRAIKALLDPVHVGIMGLGEIQAPEKVHWDPWINTRLVVVSPLAKDDLQDTLESTGYLRVDLGPYGSYERELQVVTVPFDLRNPEQSVNQCAQEASRHAFDLVIADLLHEAGGDEQWGLRILRLLNDYAPDSRRLVLTVLEEGTVFGNNDLWQAGDLIHRWQPNVPKHVRRVNLAIHWSLSMAHHLGEAKARREVMWLRETQDVSHVQVAVFSEEPSWPKGVEVGLCWLTQVSDVNQPKLDEIPKKFHPAYLIALCDDINLPCWQALRDTAQILERRLGAPPLVVVCPRSEADRASRDNITDPRHLFDVCLNRLVPDCLVQPRVGPLGENDHRAIATWISQTWLPFLEEARMVLLRRHSGLALPRQRRTRLEVDEPVATWINCEPLSLFYEGGSTDVAFESLLRRHQRGDAEASKEILHLRLPEIGLKRSHEKILKKIINSLDEIDRLPSVLKGAHREHFHHIVKVGYLGEFLLKVPSCCRSPEQPLSRRLPSLAQERLHHEIGRGLKVSKEIESAIDQDLLRAWWLAAICHDHAYPLSALMKLMVQMAEVPREVNRIFEYLRRLPLGGTPLYQALNPRRFSSSRNSVEEALDDSRKCIAGVLSVIWEESPGASEATLPSSFLHDHGILSAVNLALKLSGVGFHPPLRLDTVRLRVANLVRSYSPWMGMALRAIARHNLEADLQGEELSLLDKPIDYLLLLCDELQEWQRLVLDGGALVSPASHVEVQLIRSRGAAGNLHMFFDRRLNFRIHFPEEERLKRLGWKPESTVELKRKRLKALAPAPGIWPKEVILEIASRHSMAS